MGKIRVYFGRWSLEVGRQKLEEGVEKKGKDCYGSAQRDHRTGSGPVSGGSGAGKKRVFDLAGADPPDEHRAL